MTVEQAKKLFTAAAAADGGRYDAAVILLVNVGLAYKEILGLEWSDVNLKKNTILVAHGRHEPRSPTQRRVGRSAVCRYRRWSWRRSKRTRLGKPNNGSLPERSGRTRTWCSRIAGADRSIPTTSATDLSIYVTRPASGIGHHVMLDTPPAVSCSNTVLISRSCRRHSGIPAFASTADIYAHLLPERSGEGVGGDDTSVRDGEPDGILKCGTVVLPHWRR